MPLFTCSCQSRWWEIWLLLRLIRRLPIRHAQLADPTCISNGTMHFLYVSLYTNHLYSSRKGGVSSPSSEHSSAPHRSHWHVKENWSCRCLLLVLMSTSPNKSMYDIQHSSPAAMLRDAVNTIRPWSSGLCVICVEVITTSSRFILS